MHLTTRGVILLLVTTPFMIGGTWLPWLEWVGLALALLVVLLMVLDWSQAGDVGQFEVQREYDSKLDLGERNPVHLTLVNRGRRPARFQLRDEPPDAFEIETRILEGTIRARQTWEGTYYVRPLRRGDYEFGDINLRWHGPLALVVRQGRIERSHPVRVYPSLVDVRRYELLLRRNRLQELGLRQARTYGEGTEFERLREYLPDDSYRRIDWKATARRHRPITIEHETERSQNIIAVVDTGRMMQSPVERISKLDYVINAVLLLGYVATGMGDRVGLMTFASEVGHFLQPREGRQQFRRMLELLYAVEPQPVEPDYVRTFNYMAHKHRKRSLVVVFTDVSGGTSMASLVQSTLVLARRNLPLIVAISDPDIHMAAAQPLSDSQSVYERAAAMQLLDDRKAVLDTLAQKGVWVLDVPANNLSLSIINRYLEVKGRNLI